MEEALNDLYSKSAKIVSYGANNNSGSTITVDVGSIIIISAPSSSYATNTENVIRSLQGGQASGIGTWTCVFKATGTNIKITTDNSHQFSYIVIK